MTIRIAHTFLMIILVTAPLSVFAMTSSLTLSCKQASELVNTKGAVVLSTAPGIFDRYVSTDVYCGSGLAAAPAWIPTQDSAQCFVGATCTIPRNPN